MYDFAQAKSSTKQLEALQTKLRGARSENGDATFTFCNVAIPGLAEARAAHLTSIFYLRNNTMVFLGGNLINMFL